MAARRTRTKMAAAAARGRDVVDGQGRGYI